MKLVIVIKGKHLSFDFYQISCDDRQGDFAAYTLTGMSIELISFAKKTSLEEIYFNCIVKNGSSVILKGQNCWLNFPATSYKMTTLCVELVKE